MLSKTSTVSLLASTFLLLLSACQSTPPPSYSTPAPVAVQTLKPASSPISQTKTTGTTTVSADGSTITTEQTTTTVGFDPAKASAALVNAAVPAPVNAGFTGQWKMVSSSNGSTCNVALYGAPDATTGKAGSDCAPGFMLNGITGWSYQSGQMALMKGAETVLTLNQLSPARFDGVASSGILSTTITLKR
jgi:Protease inhibitor Inh